MVRRRRVVFLNIVKFGLINCLPPVPSPSITATIVDLLSMRPTRTKLGGILIKYHLKIFVSYTLWLYRPSNVQNYEIINSCTDNSIK